MDKTHFFGVCQEGHSHAPFAAIFRRLSRGNFVLSGRTARSRRGARCTGRFGRRACDRHSRALPLLCRERSAHPVSYTHLIDFDAFIDVTIVDGETIRQMNAEYRDKDAVTDVDVYKRQACAECGSGGREQTAHYGGIGGTPFAAASRAA